MTGMYWLFNIRCPQLVGSPIALEADFLGFSVTSISFQFLVSTMEQLEGHNRVFRRGQPYYKTSRMGMLPSTGNPIF
jgi:hypothetical protein